MSTTRYLETSKLPAAIAGFLKSAVNYNRKDIAVSAATSTSLAQGGGDGSRAFAILANLETGACTITWGSWGGANMFNRSNTVDLDTRSHEIPVNGAVIHGSIGGGRPTYASMEVHPDNLPKLLPATAQTMDEHDRAVLDAIAKYKSGDYRKEQLARIPGVLSERLDRLVASGHLKRNKAGAVSITTDGRNAR